MQRDAPGGIESRRSCQAAFLALAIFSISFGSPLLAVPGLREMRAAMHTDRSVLSLASALVWIGSGVGGIPMGWLANRIGIRKTVASGTLMMARGWRCPARDRSGRCMPGTGC
jgi:MFS family permease